MTVEPTTNENNGGRIMGGCGEWFRMVRKNKPQFTVLSAGLMTLLTTGMIVGSTIFNGNLQHQPWTFDYSRNLILLVQIVFYLGAVVGTLCGCLLVNRYEKKPLSMIYLALVVIACLLLVIEPQLLVVVAFSRTLFGLAHGMAYVIVLIHGGEVSIKQLRGMTVSAVGFCLMTGVVMFGALSSVDSATIDLHRAIGCLGLLFAVLGAVTGQLLPYESPVFLIQHGRDDDALTVMKKLRNESTETEDIRNDFTELKTMVQEDELKSRSLMEDGNRRPLVLLLLCRIASVLSFNAALNLLRLQLLDTFFEVQGYSVSPAVILMLIKILLGVTLLFVVDKLGRRFVMKASTLASGVYLLFMGLIFFGLDQLEYLADTYVAIAALLVYETIASTGITIIPDVYCSEAFSTCKKAASIAVVNTVENILQIAFTVVLFSWNFQDYAMCRFGFDGSCSGIVMVTFGAPLTVLGIVFYNVLPETTKMTVRQARTVFSKRV